MKSRDLIRVIEKDGWYEVSVVGSHHHFKHLNKTGKITIPHPRKDLPKGTVQIILKRAGLIT